MRAMLTKTVLAALLVLSIASASHADAPMEGIYLREWQFIEGTSPHQKVVVTDELKIHLIDSSTFEFQVEVTGGNAHKCWLSGSARRKGELFEYHEKLDLNPDQYCTLQFRFDKSLVHLDDAFSCKEYCGMRASIRNVIFHAPHQR